MRYDPILCMMVPDSVETKDEIGDVINYKGYELERVTPKDVVIYKNGKRIDLAFKYPKSFKEAKERIDNGEFDSVKTKDANKYVEKAVQLIKEGKGPIAILSTLKGMGLTPADANSYYAEAKSLTGYRSYDEKTIDKAIRSCDEQIRLVKTISKKNGYAIHIVEGGYGERIVLTFPNESYANPHMWLGSNNPSNIQKAKELLDEFSK